MIRAIFRDHVVRNFSLDETEPLKVLERGILKFRRLLWIQRVQLFNPIFWLYYFGSMAARLPLLICKSAGYNTTRAEQLTSVRLYIIAFQFAWFYLIADLTGLTKWLHHHVIALIFW